MPIIITATSPNLESKAKQIAKQFNFEYQPCFNVLDLNPSSSEQFLLQLTDQYLQLIDTQNSSYHPLKINFVSGKSDHRRLYGGGKSQLLAKAVGLNKGFKAHILDATAGLGGDSFVMASLGCTVTLLERSPILAAMLDDAITRAGQVGEVKQISQSMQLIHHDSIHYLCHTARHTKLFKKPDIIYLDPMFPEKKGSALVKKEMQYLQQLIGKDDDSVALLSCAIKQAKYRVVVKRPIKAPFIGDKKPLLQLSSKKQRFDIYINQKLP